MCRAAKHCTKLGTDPSNWPKFSPLTPPGWFEGQLDIFQEAILQYVNGHRLACMETLSSIRSDEMRDWYIEHGQMSGKHRAHLLGLPKPIDVEVNRRDGVRSPKSLEDQVFRRDGFRCRYCGIRLVSGKVLKALIKALDTSEFRRGPRNADTHGILCIFYPSADHVEPWHLGGRTDMENLVTSCVPCNFGKDRFTVEQIGIENPLLRSPVVEGWCGLITQLGGIRDGAKQRSGSLGCRKGAGYNFD